MASAKEIATTLVALTIAATLFAPITTAVTSNTGVQTVDNKSVTVESVGEYQQVEGYNVDGSTLTVDWYNSSSSSYETLTEGTDYEFNDSDASIKVLTSSDVSDGNELRLTYDYQATSGSTTTVADLIPLFVALLIIGVLAAKITGML